MATIKSTERGQEERLAQLKHLRETLKDLQDLGGLKDNPEWGKLVRMLRKWEGFAKNEEVQANKDHDAEEIDAVTFSRRVIRFRQKQADFSTVAEVLDKHSKMIEDFELEITKVEGQYKAAKENLD